MNNKISRQSIYLSFISILLLIFVFVFSFNVLIPKGQEYREQRLELRKEYRELRSYQNFNNNTLDRLKQLQSDNRNIITAFDYVFDPIKFQNQYKSYFNSFTLSKVNSITNDGNGFVVYEVNTTSEISSPKSFYNFLEAVNKSKWIVGVDFPINFKRDADIISSSFTVKVYYNQKDKNTTKKDLQQ